MCVVENGKAIKTRTGDDGTVRQWSRILVAVKVHTDACIHAHQFVLCLRRLYNGEAMCNRSPKVDGRVVLNVA